MQAYRRWPTGGRAAMRLEASGLACVRGGREVFAGLGFAVAAARPCWSPGRNGAGKSSLLRMVAGLVRLAGGRLALAGGDPDKTIPEQAHYLGHQDALKPSLTVAENLASGPRYLGGDGAARAGAGGRRARGAGRPAGRLPLGRPAAAAVARPAGGRPAADLAARRADLGARPRGAGHARRPDAAAPRRRRHDRRGGAWADRARPRQGAAARRAPHEPARGAVPPRHAPRGARRRRRADRRAVLSDRGRR